jgi:RNA polymerase sigma-70 factor (ECF subfamily)
VKDSPAGLQAPPVSADFQAIFAAEFSYVCRALRRLGVRQADLEDQAQEVFVSVHARFDGYDPSRPIRPWLFAFAFRAASNYQRLARHRHERPGEVAEAESAHTPELALADRQKQELVLSALEGVPLERRSALIMHDIDGFSAPEIADALAVPINTVYSRVRVARDEFRAALKRVERRRGAS